eukprot:c20910_g1_i4 orf=288-512(+)
MTMMGPNLFVQLAIWTLAFYFLFLGADRTFYRKADVAPNTSRVAWHAVLFCSILQATVKETWPSFYGRKTFGKF